MSQIAYFFDSVLVNGVYDRKYNSDDFAEFFAGLISNGILYGYLSSLEVIVSSGMEITVRPGIAFVKGYMYKNTDDTTLTVATASASYNRIDRVVLGFDKVNRTMSLYMKAGTASASPIAPDLVQTDSLFELGLYKVNVGVGVTEVLSQNLIDNREDGTVCGYITTLFPSAVASYLDDMRGTLSIPKGGTGATTAEAARASLGVPNTDVVTPTSNGLMSAADKTKLNGIAASANNYTHPTSGVTAGSYRQLTVDANGHVTAGNNTTIPASAGGTGQTSLQAARNAMGLGNTLSALPIAVGGTEATTALGARQNLRIFVAASLPGSATEGDIYLVP